MELLETGLFRGGRGPQGTEIFVCDGIGAFDAIFVRDLPKPGLPKELAQFESRCLRTMAKCGFKVSGLTKTSRGGLRARRAGGELKKNPFTRESFTQAKTKIADQHARKKCDWILCQHRHKWLEGY